MQDATLGARAWVRLRDRVTKRKELLRYRKKNKGLLPALTWRESVWKFKHGVDPNAKLIEVELLEEARLTGQQLPKPVPAWAVAGRHAIAYAVQLVLVAIALGIVAIILHFAAGLSLA